ncbi:MAG: hypothetical protein A3G49_04785 [Candidatus Sungbacteria bacterium RIFCSPLOWO2_12_FULL_41_11]|uniref:Uncharacterized protein n=1 Tax=Candidatus Sungbacteria bacterium RIFCSPLOWO2_12_FULL_41_11 TaxID=1802286 RepID=A0A1G2LNC5_9BACT|nr:MAG: hypothetical protein UV01_C0004G0009 [Parcubacteria group bacterium GW2011_GWA2_42_14]OGZ99626.1 MAG: hypothetical protein A3D41_05755 [Candidatus Sungbacteria bacterium RIFCSPHIGHO2_02_FULL_41_12b]OHA13024.1 MAG: hypothetical protein A3G49_04785 [Candidatus Sungbacteria bacterium RIFCSPLOWO2_12_FULL_41_11]
MGTVTIPKEEYNKLKRFSSAYVKIAEEIAKIERFYPYDYKYIAALRRRALSEYRNGKSIEAGSVDEALAKSKRK